MTTFRIVLGNHPKSLMTALSPLSRHLQAALQEAGHLTHVTYDELSLDGVALVFERFSEDESVEALQAFVAAGGVLGLICPDCVSLDGINIVDGVARGSDYPDMLRDGDMTVADHLGERFNRLQSVAPLSRFIWALDQASVEPLIHIAGHQRVRHLRFGFIEDFLEMPMLPLAERTYDFGFFGRPSAYRKHLVEALEACGYSVYSPKYFLPHYLKIDLMSRVKIQLCLRIDEDWEYYPSQTAAFSLNNQAFQVASNIPLDHLEQFIPSVLPDSLVDHCINALEGRAFFEEQLKSFQKFQQEQPMRPLMQDALSVLELEDQ